MTLLDDQLIRVRPDSAARPVLITSGAGLALVPRRRRDTVLARLRSGSLDRQLAAGTAAETSRLLATRAAMLTSPRARHSIARCWDELVARAARSPYPADRRVPVRRPAVRAAHEHIAALTQLLRSDRPVSAAGVAAARLLLTDGGSPVYDLRRADTDAVAAAIARVMTAL